MNVKNMVKKMGFFLLSAISLFNTTACGSSKDSGAELHQTLQSSDRLTATTERLFYVNLLQLDEEVNIV